MFFPALNHDLNRSGTGGSSLSPETRLARVFSTSTNRELSPSLARVVMSKPIPASIGFLPPFRSFLPQQYFPRCPNLARVSGYRRCNLKEDQSDLVSTRTTGMHSPVIVRQKVNPCRVVRNQGKSIPNKLSSQSPSFL